MPSVSGSAEQGYSVLCGPSRAGRLPGAMSPARSPCLHTTGDARQVPSHTWARGWHLLFHCFGQRKWNSVGFFSLRRTETMLWRNLKKQKGVWHPTCSSLQEPQTRQTIAIVYVIDPCRLSSATRNREVGGDTWMRRSAKRKRQH